MKLAVKPTSAAVAVAATAGISGLFMGAAPASAGPTECGTGTLVSTGICEQVFTSTTATNFTPPAQASKLEALLVGGGGAGGGRAASATSSPATTGYALGGGGGQVKIVDFTSTVGSTTPLVVQVGNGGEDDSDGGATTVTGGPTASAAGGSSIAGPYTTGGSSGTHTGASISDGQTPPTYYGGGAGASASTTTINGGSGAQISTTFSSDSLFGSDPSCYGGGGAALEDTTVGTASCGGNAPSSDPTATSYPAASANTGGGGAGSAVVGYGGDGSDGLVVFRWSPSYTLTFAADGHGTAPAVEQVTIGSAPSRPATPTADGYTFEGWYTDSALTTKADFSQPLTADTTFYAKWVVALAETGGGPSPYELPIAGVAIVAGLGLLGSTLYRRKRRAH